MHTFLASIVLVAVLLAPHAASAQDERRPHSLEAGAWAVLYQVEDIGRLTFFDGMLAVKYHLSPKQALRVGIGANAGTSNDAENLSGGVSVQSLYFLYLQPESEVKFYLGAGPRIGYDFGRTETSPSTKLRNQRWTVGVAGRLGTEWFATKSISLFAEYGNYLGMDLRKHEVNPTQTQSSQDYFYRTSLTLGLGAYF